MTDMTPTPDTLRDGLPIPVGEQPDEQAWLDAHADAWKAQVKKAEERAFTHQVIDATLELRDENTSLRKRLEEAERMLRAIAMYGECLTVLDARKMKDMAESHFICHPAALAGKEKQTIYATTVSDEDGISFGDERKP